MVDLSIVFCKRLPGRVFPYKINDTGHIQNHDSFCSQKISHIFPVEQLPSKKITSFILSQVAGFIPYMHYVFNDFLWLYGDFHGESPIAG